MQLIMDLTYKHALNSYSNKLLTLLMHQALPPPREQENLPRLHRSTDNSLFLLASLERQDQGRRLNSDDGTDSSLTFPREKGGVGEQRKKNGEEGWPRGVKAWPSGKHGCDGVGISSGNPSSQLNTQNKETRRQRDGVKCKTLAQHPKHALRVGWGLEAAQIGWLAAHQGLKRVPSFNQGWHVTNLELVPQWLLERDSMCNKLILFQYCSFSQVWCRKILFFFFQGLEWVSCWNECCLESKNECCLESNVFILKLTEMFIITHKCSLVPFLGKRNVKNLEILALICKRCCTNQTYYLGPIQPKIFN